MKKGAVLAGVCLPALILLAGCRGKNNLRIAGGGMVKNAALVTENTESALAVELPLITDRELRDVEVTDTHLSGEGALRFDYKGMTEGGRYKGYYYYFMHFSALVSREEKTDLKVESIDLLADGESVKYRPDTLTFMNSEASIWFINSREYAELSKSMTATLASFAILPLSSTDMMTVMTIATIRQTFS